MEKKTYSRKDTGKLVERIAAVYLERHGFTVCDRNVSRKTGELDLVAWKGEGRERTLHVIEVKAARCKELPENATRSAEILYDPANNLHARKIRKIVRTAEWYAADIGWKGSLQIDGVLVWIRIKDTHALVRFLPQILA